MMCQDHNGASRASAHSPTPSTAIADARPGWVGSGYLSAGAVRSTWPRALWAALALTAAVLATDLLIPGLPAKHPGVVGRLAAVMTGICPQRPSHSYTLGGVQLPLEARMMCMFVGLTIGVLELATLGRARTQRWPRPVVAVALLLGLAAMAFDGTNALLFDLRLPHAYSPDLRLRLATGVLAGLAMAFGLVPTLGQVVTDPDALTPGARPGWWDVGWALLGSGGVALLIASGWAPLLTPLALVGAGGVVLAFTLINRVALAAIVIARGGGDAGQRHEWMLATLATGLSVGELVVLAELYSLIAPR